MYSGLSNYSISYETDVPELSLRRSAKFGSESKCMEIMQKILGEIRNELSRRTAWLPFSYKAYLYGGSDEAADDCLYFCVTDDPLENIGQPLDHLQGEVLPDWFYVRIHIVRHSYLQFKIANPGEMLINCSIRCKCCKEAVRPIACGNGRYMEQVDESLKQYLQSAFRA